MPPTLLGKHKITINGPFWSASATVVAGPSAEGDVAHARYVFVENEARTVFGIKRVHVPGTIVALVFVESVRVRPDDEGPISYRWRRDANETAPQVDSVEEMRDLLHARGQLALLLLEVDPARLVDRVFTCTAGEIALGALPPREGAMERLYDALDLEPPQQEQDDPRGTVAVHSSGLTLFGQARLPWDVQPISGPFQLARQWPEGDAPAFRLTPEVDRMTQDQRQDLLRRWLNLGRTLSPRNPLINDPSGLAETPTPTWVTLELVNPFRVPRIYWEISPWQESPASLPFHLERGELDLLLSDMQPYAADRTRASMATFVPDDVLLSGDREAGLTLSARIGRQVGPEERRLAYSWQRETQQRDLVTLFNLRVAYDPTETPEFLREHQELETPEWLPGEEPQPVEPALVWGFMPLADGWAQLPVPNLTEQIYLDAELARPSMPIGGHASAALRGAVSLGNQAVLAAYPGEQPWDVTLVNAQRAAGTWELEFVDGEYVIQSVALEVYEPEIVLNGLFWLSTGQPTAKDALPDLDDWLNGLRSIPLTTVSESDLFPAPIKFDLNTLTVTLREPLPLAEGESADGAVPSAELSSWTLNYAADAAVVREMVSQRVLPASLFEDPLPLVWRRHPALPMIQALPLTQSQSPPNYPSASRQLVPFELEVSREGDDAVSLPLDWRFGTLGENGAAQWPHLLAPEKSAPAREWQGRYDLPLVALSLPGLVLDPHPESGETGLALASGLDLPVQYRYDLPYADQLNALAQLPKIPRDPDQVSPLPDSPPPLPPEPLTRETYAEHWRTLSTQASLASADAVDAFSAESSPADGDRVLVSHLVEPYTWPVKANVSQGAYPGSLEIENESGGAALTLEQELALEGISGRFVLDDAGHLERQTGQADERVPYLLKAGSMAAHVDGANGTYTDQRGLSRAASAQTGNLIETAIQLRREAGILNAYDLSSLLEPVELFVPGNKPWRFWFRDLPVETASSVFARATIRSGHAEDVNDPEALAREYNYLNGYEWRLGAQEVGDDPYLVLCGLHFYPLTLEAVRLQGDAVAKVQVVGRLQLPLAGSGELEDLSNAVRLTFTPHPTENRLELSAVDAGASAPVDAAFKEWPLALTGSEMTDAPRLEWREISLDRERGAIEVGDVWLRFFLLDVEWDVRLAPLVFESTPQDLAREYPFSDVDTSAPIYPHSIALEIAWSQGGAPGVSAFLKLAVQLGVHEPDGSPGASPASAPQSSFEAMVSISLIDQEHPYAWEGESYLFGDNKLRAQDRSMLLAENALQFEWNTVDAPAPPQLLSGMEVATVQHGDVYRARMPGFATATFDVLSLFTLDPALQGALNGGQVNAALEQAFREGGLELSAAATLSILQADARWWVGDGQQSYLVQRTDGTISVRAGVPRLLLRSSFVETLIACRWGAFLQDARESPIKKQVFGSSAGDVVCGYTARWEEESGRWDETFLLNGLLEVKNLISWPLEMHLDDDKTLLSLPPLDVGLPAGSGPKMQHTRHTIRILLNQHQIPRDVLVVGRGGAIVELENGGPWQFLAVVEHQLVDVSLGDTLDDLSLENDRRWTALQEVRLISPNRFGQFLQVQSQNRILAEDGVSTYGYWEDGLWIAGHDSVDQHTPGEGGKVVLQLDWQAPLPSGPLWSEVKHDSGEDAFWRFRVHLREGRWESEQFAESDRTEEELGHRPLRWMIYEGGPGAPDRKLLAISDPFSFPTRSTRRTLSMTVRERDLCTGCELTEVAPDTLLVEASAPHWIRQEPVATASATTLQFLPSGVQLGILGAPSDYLPSSPDAPKWMLLAAPFLGRLQMAGHDQLDGTPPLTELTSPFEVDPIVYHYTKHEQMPSAPSSVLALVLSNWSARQGGLIAHYRFEQGADAGVVHDVSGVGPAVDLQIADPQHVEWLSDGGLKINESTIVASQDPPAKIVEAVLETGEITVEAWVEPANTTQSGPARIVSLSKSITHRNLTLGQLGDEYEARLRTTERDGNGLPSLRTDPGVVTTALSHVVYTRDALGQAHIYLDGTSVASGTVAGDLGNWDPSLRLLLANELTLDRPWQGIYRQVSIYDRALTATEVREIWSRGVGSITLPPAPNGGTLVPEKIGVSFFDSAIGRTWPQLDPMSLEENWFRLQNPLDELQPAGLQSVMAALPNNPARLSRSTALERAFDVYRPAYPPALPDATASAQAREREDALVWREGRFLTLQGASTVASESTPPYGWHLAGLLLRDSDLGRSTPDRRRYPSATLLPARLEVEGKENRFPVSFAVPPYLGLEYRAATSQAPHLSSVELLCLDPISNELRPVTSRFVEHELPPSEASIRQDSMDWGHETQVRLVPESPLSILRFRTISHTSQPGLLTIGYSFALVAEQQARQALSKHVFRMRTAVTNLRFREGQFGGNQMPQEVHDFEIAPPQTTGVQPIYLTQAPATVGKEQPSWPWGLSALRMSIVYARNQEGKVQGIAGKVPTLDGDATHTIWWQALQHFVQYRSALRSERPVAGLPPLFRAQAIKSLLPVLANPPMPPVKPQELFASSAEPVDCWQPVLPGALRYLLVGARPGVMVAMRHQLLRQSGLDPDTDEPQEGQVLVSGSVPVQHRTPRPVPLPANASTERALQTWAGHFEPGRHALITDAPADEAFFADCGGRPAKGVRIVLSSPALGAVLPDWDGALEFAIDLLPDLIDLLGEWKYEVSLVGGETVVHYHREGISSSFVPKPGEPAVGDAFADGQAEVVVVVKPPTGTLKQTLSFPLRARDPDVLRLPLAPRYIHFEDPEYNRRLASSSAHAAKAIPVVIGDEQAMYTLTLAADRHEYNPDSTVALRYDWQDEFYAARPDTAPLAGHGRLFLERVTEDGVRESFNEDGYELAPGTLWQYALEGKVQPGDKLQLSVRVKEETGAVEIEESWVVRLVEIVAEPVTPVPEAGYGLLYALPSEDGLHVECARFAWDPEPLRVELVCEDDLKTEVVRRRAVFHWRHTVRAQKGTLSSQAGSDQPVQYEIQKITHSGATHFAEFKLPEA